MTVQPAWRYHGRLARWQGRLGAWRYSSVYSRSVDILAATTAASLPWSTSATAILVALWIVVLVPTVDWGAFSWNLSRPACALPLAFFGLAIVGVLWSESPWSASLHGINPVSKLLVIPLLLYHFQRSQRGTWVFLAFLGSCTLLMILSWIVLFVPEFKIARTVSDGVPVKNYIDQSQEFALCAFALARPALILFRQWQWGRFVGCMVLILAFVANMLFVASARTALIYMTVLLVLFALLHLRRRAMLALFAATAVASMLVWTTSPYLRQRIADIAVEYQGHDNKLLSTAQRLNFWRKSLKFFANAPLLGHGTGSIKTQFERDAIGQTGLRAEVVSNPHNQTLNVVVQWGLIGGFVLYGMWLSHLLLFRGEGLAAWIGLVAVVQNFVSSLLNSHLFDFHEGWMYVLGVGVAGGMSLGGKGLGRSACLQLRQVRPAPVDEIA
jgi:O-antigen ligase